ncbi:MAG: 2-oxoacid:acceptor oxidoreductase subunit alpha [Myxococcota bacterium]|jgi:2-oxoglutarate ferredoxin oxidoreductase subunit alpha|nr:2-oxoacid:acceptor oxidoreductase subunit alpha [Myxococcota bacterium]MDP6244625.1 2-oxoacid:acceptor oxidoreductase subunit alpha [Myxococcota bacterium]MDP7074947.1 2-oxoacid:acceptor oxidoreductase subunit alpha [Myxococcota bacterium]MDP7298991.1 2-oxoacid:acceptor oxidoreductase subunit alpha [Myxococcota bacterium]MDP7433196.1 2-oxoacid:acceptor oxidoreductase subunit alpha [Myxococcota bacterium]
MSQKPTKELQSVAIRFTGDSGDGMQLTGTKFTESTALAGNDLSTLPDFPAEIRAPAGTLAGVSGFQIHFSSQDIRTPADHPDVLVSFNPAALRANLDDVRSGGTVILNSDAFTVKALARAGYTEDPRPTLADQFQLIEVPLTKLNRAALKDLKLSSREADRCKNFFALGLMYWLYNRPMESTLRWLEGHFAGNVLEANQRVLKAGYAFGETSEIFPRSFVVPRAKIEPGHYRNITGNTALAWGIVAASQIMDRPVFLGAYPITPASEVLHEVSRYRHFGVKTFQAEDEIAAASTAIGASFAGSLGVCTTSSPGFLLKQEALGLAVMAELPLVVVNIQRAGPSTGMPTKAEQADLLAALHGRNSESPVPVLAADTPGNCFDTVLEAFRLAVRHMTPVIVLSDSYLANSAEPWPIPDVASLGHESVPLRVDPAGFQPYARDDETLARPWAVPGTPGLEHRIGGLSKQEGSGNVSYDPRNNERMHELRHEKVARIAAEIPAIEVMGPDRGELLVVGWGGTRGAIVSACEEVRRDGLSVSNIHLRHLNPFPSDLGEVLSRFEKVLVAELNAGQLALLLRAEFLVDAQCLAKIKGQPFRIEEIRARIDAMLQEN